MKPIFLALLPAMILCGQENPPESEESPCEMSWCCPGPRPHQFKLKHLEYQGIGFNQGYTSFELFLSNAEPWKCSNYLFLDLRGHVFNDGKPAFNGGVGWRYLIDSLCGAIGANAYYDYRNTKHKTYNQFGFGLEYLAPQWEARANGYFPCGSRVSHLFDLEFDHFAGHELFISRKREFAMTGGDAEIGWHFVQWRYVDLYVGAGPYYFKGHLGKPAIGGKGRIEARITPYVSLEIGDSYDAVFRNRFHAEAAINIPIGPRTTPRGNCCSSDDQIALQKWLHDAPYRNEMIVVDTKRKTSAAIDPSDGIPYFFVFVDNTSSSNGTFESPYPTLTAAETNSEPGDIIYVFPGDGTDTGMNVGIFLQNNQRLLGAGIPHYFLTTLGSVPVPPQASGLPLISNSATLLNDVVNLENNNEVSGFFINQINVSNAIFASIRVGNNTFINRNIIQVHNDGTGVFLQGNPFMGNVNISNNLFLGADTSNTFGIDFFLAEVGNIYIANNVFTGVDAASGIANGIDFFHTQNFNATVINNTFSSVASNGVIPHAIGVDPFTTQGTFFLDLNIVGNQINLPSTMVGAIGGVVIKDEAGEGPYSILLQNNTVVTPAGVPGFLIDNAGNSSEISLDFGPNNSGTLEIIGTVTLIP